MRVDLARHVCWRSLTPTHLPPLSITPTVSVPVTSVFPAIRRYHHPRPRPTSHASALCRPSAQQTRPFISLFNSKKNAPKEVELEPGWDDILKWVGRMHENIRGQKRQTLRQAFIDLFAYKNRYATPVNSSQANQCHKLFRYLLDDPLEEGGRGLMLEDLIMVREALLRPPKDNPVYHLAFSRELFEEIQIRRRENIDDVFGQGLAEVMDMESAGPGLSETPTAESDPEVDDPKPSAKLPTVQDADFRCYLVALSQYGAASEASDLIKPFWHDLMVKDRVYKGSKSLWIVVMRGLARENKEEELKELVTFADVAGVEYMPAFHEVMTTFYAHQDRIAETKEWFRKPIYGRWLPTAHTYYEILKFCIRTKESRWAKDIFQNLIESNPRKELWDVCFQWAVLFLGKSTQDIKHMFTVMEQNNQDDPLCRPDIDTINSLIRAAADRHEPLLAERFVTLATELGIRPNAAMSILQLEYRLDAGDMSGSKAAYQDLQLAETPAADGDVPITNRYIRALCHVRTLDMAMATRVVNDLEHRSITLDPATVVALSIAMLQTNAHRELADTLSLNVFQYSATQRSSIRDAFVTFILDMNNSTERVWQAYNMLHHYFAETPQADRLRIIEGFFRRGEPDKGATVFANMRNHPVVAVHPDTEDYISVLQLFATLSSSQSGLRTVYNLLKMDPNVVPCTRLYNAVMLAFGSCGQHARALEFWNEIAHSIEGPSYESIEIVFWVCEAMPFGERTARAVWRNLEKMEIEVPGRIAGAYAGALAGGGVLGDVISFFKGMEASVGYEPDADMLGIAYNALPGQDLQRSFEFWVRTAFPKQWMHLEAIGRDETPLFLQRFRVSRDLKA